MVWGAKNRVKRLTSRSGDLGAAHSPPFRWLDWGIGFTRARHWNNKQRRGFLGISVRRDPPVLLFQKGLRAIRRSHPNHPRAGTRVRCTGWGCGVQGAGCGARVKGTKVLRSRRSITGLPILCNFNSRACTKAKINIPLRRS